ncbi:hypothetical protein DPEC_G00117170 [Dallia pectoralis]|uniref:Uncharacterized protein n=1 Tax=Dallia pectoralis TaxID=75939 RepID=A0ACC2GUR5_DALPE|nr:hypothetical protein DPEC_G00117170 [Dallia pectoralis]
MAADFSQDSVLYFIRSNGGKVRNADLLAHYKPFIKDHENRTRNRELFKTFVNSVAVVKTEEGVSYVVLRRKHLGDGGEIHAGSHTPDARSAQQPAPQERPKEGGLPRSTANRKQDKGQRGWFETHFNGIRQVVPVPPGDLLPAAGIVNNVQGYVPPRPYKESHLPSYNAAMPKQSKEGSDQRFKVEINTEPIVLPVPEVNNKSIYMAGSKPDQHSKEPKRKRSYPPRDFPPMEAVLSVPPQLAPVQQNKVQRPRTTGEVESKKAYAWPFHSTLAHATSTPCISEGSVPSDTSLFPVLCDSEATQSHGSLDDDRQHTIQQQTRPKQNGDVVASLFATSDSQPTLRKGSLDADLHIQHRIQQQTRPKQNRCPVLITVTDIQNPEESRAAALQTPPENSLPLDTYQYHTPPTAGTGYPDHQYHTPPTAGTGYPDHQYHTPPTAGTGYPDHQYHTPPTAGTGYPDHQYHTPPTAGTGYPDHQYHTPPTAGTGYPDHQYHTPPTAGTGYPDHQYHTPPTAGTGYPDHQYHTPPIAGTGYPDHQFHCQASSGLSASQSSPFLASSEDSRDDWPKGSPGDTFATVEDLHYQGGNYSGEQCPAPERLHHASEAKLLPDMQRPQDRPPRPCSTGNLDINEADRTSPWYHSTDNLHGGDGSESSSFAGSANEPHLNPPVRRIISRLRSRMTRSLGADLDQLVPEDSVSARHNRLHLLSSNLSTGHSLSNPSSRTHSCRDLREDGRSRCSSNKSLNGSHDSSYFHRHNQVPLESNEHDWLVKGAAGSWPVIYDLFRDDPSLLTKRDFITGYNILHWIAKHGDHRVLNTLAYGAEKVGVKLDVDAKTTCGYTALHLAALHENKQMVRLLVQKFKANVALRDTSGKKAWQYLSGPRDLLDLLGAPQCSTSAGSSTPKLAVNSPRSATSSAAVKRSTSIAAFLNKTLVKFPGREGSPDFLV